MGSNPIVASMKAGAVVSFYSGLLMGLGALIAIPSLIVVIAPVVTLLQWITSMHGPDNMIEALGPLFIPALVGIAVGFMLILVGDLCALVVGMARSIDRSEQLTELILRELRKGS